MNYQRILFDFAYLTPEIEVLGAVAVLLALEAIRRAVADLAKQTSLLDASALDLITRTYRNGGLVR